MLYQLFAGRFPFWEQRDCQATKLDEVADAVLHAEVRFDFGPWLHMTSEGKDFIERCLNRDQDQRITIDQALRHRWFFRFLSAANRAHASPSAALRSNIVPNSSKRRVREKQRM